MKKGYRGMYVKNTKLLPYQQNIQTYPKGGTLFFESVLLKYTALHKCIGLHTLGIFHRELETIAAHKTSS